VSWTSSVGEARREARAAGPRRRIEAMLSKACHGTGRLVWSDYWRVSERKRGGYTFVQPYYVGTPGLRSVRNLGQAGRFNQNIVVLDWKSSFCFLFALCAWHGFEELTRCVHYLCAGFLFLFHEPCTHLFICILCHVVSSDFILDCCTTFCLLSAVFICSKDVPYAFDSHDSLRFTSLFPSASHALPSRFHR